MKIGMKQYESEAKARMNKSNPVVDTTSPSTNEAVVSYETQMNGGHENGHVSNGVIHS